MTAPTSISPAQRNAARLWAWMLADEAPAHSQTAIARLCGVSTAVARVLLRPEAAGPKISDRSWARIVEAHEHWTRRAALVLAPGAADEVHRALELQQAALDAPPADPAR